MERYSYWKFLVNRVGAGDFSLISLYYLETENKKVLTQELIALISGNTSYALDYGIVSSISEVYPQIRPRDTGTVEKMLRSGKDPNLVKISLKDCMDLFRKDHYREALITSCTIIESKIFSFLVERLIFLGMANNISDAEKFLIFLDLRGLFFLYWRSQGRSGSIQAINLVHCSDSWSILGQHMTENISPFWPISLCLLLIPEGGCQGMGWWGPALFPEIFWILCLKEHKKCLILAHYIIFSKLFLDNFGYIQ